MQETWVRSQGREDPLEKEMATHSSIHAWRILWTEEPGGLQSMGSQSWTQLSDSHTHTEKAQLWPLNYVVNGSVPRCQTWQVLFGDSSLSIRRV